MRNGMRILVAEDEPDAARMLAKGLRARMHRGGAGLGLPIARWIAEAHGGSLVLAEHDGRGSRFVATVRLTPSQERAEAL